MWTRHPALTVVLASTGLSLVVTFPLVFNMTTSIYGYPGDSTGTIATFWWWSYAVSHGKSLFDNSLVGVPLGSGWEQVPFAVIPVAVVTPLTVLFPPMVAYNLVMLSSFPLTAWATYLLARRLGIPVLAAAFSALAFAFTPFHVEKAMGHLMQTHMELFPGALLFLVRWWQGGSRWNLAAAGAVVGLGIWTDYYLAYILIFMVAAFFAVSWLFSPGAGRLGRRLIEHLGAAGIVAAVTAAFLPLAAILAHRPGSGSYQQAVTSNLQIYRRELLALDIYSVRPWEYLFPWHANPLLPPRVNSFLVAHLHGSNFTEQSLVVGYTVLLLALAGVLLSHRTFPVRLSLAVLLTGLALALPPVLRLDGLKMLAPSRVFYHFLPFFRVYSRFGILVLLGACLLAGVGFGLFQARTKAWGLPWLAAVPFLLLALEFNNQPPTHTTTLFPAPQEYDWLRAQPPGTLIEYPLHEADTPRQEIYNRQYAFYQQVHQHPMFNGAAPDGPAGRLEPALEPYYKAEVVDQLRGLGIRYVFVHTRVYAVAGYDVPLAVAGLQFVRSFGETDVFLVGGSVGGS